MKTKRDISGLSARRSVLCVLSVIVLCLASCKTPSQFPIDDAYYCPAAQSAQSAQPVPATPSFEYLNVQDTTVTIRIRK